MDLDRRHFRHLLLFFFDQNIQVPEAYKRIKQTYRKSLHYDTCKRWYRKFKRGNFDVNLSDKKKKFTHEELHKLLDENPTLTRKEMATKLNVSESYLAKMLRTIRNLQTVRKRMDLSYFERRKFKDLQDLIDTNPNLSQKQMATELYVSESEISRFLQCMPNSQTKHLIDANSNLSRKRMATKLDVSESSISRFSQCMPNFQQKLVKSIDLVSHIQCYSCISLLSRHKNQRRFWDRIVTGGEIAVSYYTPNHTEANTSNENKLTLYIWWNTKGIIYYELLSHESALNQYSQQLKNLKQALDSKQPQKANKNRKVILLHSFFAEINILTFVKDQILEYGWEVLPYPATSFDVTPSKRHLLPRIQDAFNNQHFRTFEEVETSVGVRINTINNSPAIINDCGISSLPEIWDECIETKGNFVTEV